MNSSKFKEIIKIGLTLFAITAVSATLLATVNKLTAPVIAKNQLKKTYASMEKVISNAKEFQPINLSDTDKISEAYFALDANGEKIGVCVISKSYGYGGEITVLTGVVGGKICGIDILSHTETPGLGAKTTNPDFKEQFEGKTNCISIVKSGASGNEINAISGATISSTAVTNAVNEALKFSSEVEK